MSSWAMFQIIHDDTLGLYNGNEKCALFEDRV